MSWIPGILFLIGGILLFIQGSIFLFFLCTGQNGNLSTEGELTLYKSGFFAGIGAVIVYVAYRLNELSLTM